MAIVSFIILLVLSIGIYSSTYYYDKNNVSYIEDDTQDKCNAANQIKDLSKGFENGDDCHIWDGHQCRRGKYESSTNNCIAKGDYIPLIGLILSATLFISSLISLFL
jgi:hypothetical protein